MQKMEFANGGFVLHKITHLSRGRISAWFDAAGDLVDCELIDSCDRSRPIKRGGPLWQDVARLGRIMSGRHHENPARVALTRAIDRAIANGSPVFVEIPPADRT